MELRYDIGIICHDNGDTYVTKIGLKGSRMSSIFFLWLMFNICLSCHAWRSLRDLLSTVDVLKIWRNDYQDMCVELYGGNYHFYNQIQTVRLLTTTFLSRCMVCLRNILWAISKITWPNCEPVCTHFNAFNIFITTWIITILCFGGIFEKLCMSSANKRRRFPRRPECANVL